jgi:sulfur-carrier protein
MNVTVKFFASLREQTGIDTVSVVLDDVCTAHAAWHKATTEALEEHILVAINQQYAAQESLLAEGDEIAFFPPVTGG